MGLTIIAGLREVSDDLDFSGGVVMRTVGSAGWGIRADGERNVGCRWMVESREWVSSRKYLVR